MADGRVRPPQEHNRSMDGTGSPSRPTSSANPKRSYMDSRFYLPRRDVLKLIGAGAGAFALGRAPAFAAATPLDFQLSWLSSVQFGGSYIALDQGFWKGEDPRGDAHTGRAQCAGRAAGDQRQGADGHFGCRLHGGGRRRGREVQDHRRRHAEEPLRHRFAGEKPGEDAEGSRRQEDRHGHR